MQTEFKKLIESNNYDSALKLLREQNVFDTPINEFNWGYLNYKTKNFVEARYHLEKAMKLGLFSSEVNEALEIVIAELNITSIESSYEKEDLFMLNTTGYNGDFYGSLIGFFLLVGLFVSYRARYFVGSIFFILSFLIGIFVYQTQDYKLKIVSNESIVYAGPSRIFDELQMINPGIKIISTKRAGDWTYVEYPKLYKGWVYKLKGLSL